MAAIHARGKNGDNSILVGKGLKMQNSQTKLNCCKNIRKSPILDIAPYTNRVTDTILDYAYLFVGYYSYTSIVPTLHTHTLGYRTTLCIVILKHRKVIATNEMMFYLYYIGYFYP